jgi:hypothetical protein
MITHTNYIATYTVIRRGTKYIHCRLYRNKGKLIIDRILINEISKDWAPGETYTIRSLHHDMPVLKGHRTYHNVIIEPQEILSPE